MGPTPPVRPVAPTAPAGPTGPMGPMGPMGPRGPGKPRGPRGPTLTLTLTACGLAAAAKSAANAPTANRATVASASVPERLRYFIGVSLLRLREGSAPAETRPPSDLPPPWPASYATFMGNTSGYGHTFGRRPISTYGRSGVLAGHRARVLRPRRDVG